MLKVDAPELRAALLLTAKSSRDVQRDIRAATKQYTPRVRRDLAQGAPLDPVTQQLIRRAQVTTTSKGVKLVVGSSGKRGTVPYRDLVRPWEFGGNPQRYDRYTGRRGSSRFTVNRRTQTPIPSRRRNGWFVHPAVARIAPGLTTAWVRAVVSGYRKAGL